MLYWNRNLIFFTYIYRNSKVKWFVSGNLIRNLISKYNMGKDFGSEV